MALFKKLFGCKDPAASPAATVKVFDAYGRQVEIPREEWRTKVLPATFQKQWNNADALADVIGRALQDGFVAECLDPARQLLAIDPNPLRGANLLGVTLLQLKIFDEAEKVFTEVLTRQGNNTLVLANLSRVYVGRDDLERAEHTLWQAVELDPNQSTAFARYLEIRVQRAGEEARAAALQQVADLPKSWRAQLFLARAALDRKDLPAATALYEIVFQRAQPLPSDALMQISGDLGNHGHIKELADLCVGRFDAGRHGFEVGNNLIKACIELRRPADARTILQQLYAQQRPDWKQGLVYWESQISVLDRNYGPVASPDQLKLQILSVDGPIWAVDGSPFGAVLPGKSSTCPRVGFLCGSASVPQSAAAGTTITQPTDAAGRFTRALPLYLAEQTHLRTPAMGMVYVPWIDQGGFCLAGKPWTADTLGEFSHNPTALVLLHIDAAGPVWQADFTLVRMADRATLASWKQAVDVRRMAEVVPELADQFFSRLSTANISAALTLPAPFAPIKKSLSAYLIGLEQGLAISCAANFTQAANFFYAERSMLDNLLHTCVNEPDSVASRFLLLSSLLRLVKIRKEIVEEYRQRMEMLQTDHPLAPAAQQLAAAAMAQVFP